MKNVSHEWQRWIRPAREALCEVPRSDLHMHTTWTDGRCSAQDYMLAARALELECIAITEHVGYESDWYPDFASEIEGLRILGGPPRLYRGIEVTAWDYEGKLKASDALLQQAEIVIGVVHRYPRLEGGPQGFEGLDRKTALELEIKALMALARNPKIDILGHPGGTFFRKFGAFEVTQLAEVFRTAKANDIIVEISAKYTWDWPGLFSVLWDVDPLVSISSDAHDVSELGRTQREMDEPLTSFLKAKNLRQNG